MKQFAEKGFSATTVAEIEAAVGLQPRRGALYKHFPSKEALLEEGVRRHIDMVAMGATQVIDLELTSAVTADPALLRPVVRGLGRWFLDELDRQRDLVRLLEHEAGRFAHLTDDIRRDIIDTGSRAGAHLLVSAAPDVEDPEATAVMLLSSLVGLRRTTWTMGAPPLAVKDHRCLDRWTDIVLTLVAAARDPDGRRR